MLIYGYGSDGMVTTSKDILTIIGNNTDKCVQGYFNYDSKKSGGITKCNLRFSDSNREIKSTYYVFKPSIVVCTKDSYMKKYGILDNIRENAIFILNTEHDIETLNDVLTKEDIEILNNRNITFYIVNANKVARDNNIPNKISMIMEAVILKACNLYPFSEAEKDIINRIKTNFAKKGEEVVNNNINALKDALTSLTKIDVKKLSSTLEKEKVNNTVFSKLSHLRNDLIKVSDLEGHEGGIYEPNLASLEKRGISNITPSYDSNKCIMCNMCSFVCPHAVIRPYLLTEEEASKCPDYIKETLKDANIKGENYKFTVCMSPLDCTGCKLCESVCPTKAITMQAIKLEEQKRFDYLEKNVTEKHPLNINSIKGSQFVKPSFNYSGACSGCGDRKSVV